MKDMTSVIYPSADIWLLNRAGTLVRNPEKDPYSGSFAVVTHLVLVLRMKRTAVVVGAAG